MVDAERGVCVPEAHHSAPVRSVTVGTHPPSLLPRGLLSISTSTSLLSFSYNARSTSTAMSAPTSNPKGRNLLAVIGDEVSCRSRRSLS